MSAFGCGGLGFDVGFIQRLYGWLPGSRCAILGYGSNDFRGFGDFRMIFVPDSLLLGDWL
jgi:hypothetical protein